MKNMDKEQLYQMLVTAMHDLINMKKGAPQVAQNLYDQLAVFKGFAEAEKSK